MYSRKLAQDKYTKLKELFQKALDKENKALLNQALELDVALDNLYTKNAPKQDLYTIYFMLFELPKWMQPDYAWWKPRLDARKGIISFRKVTYLDEIDFVVSKIEKALKDVEKTGIPVKSKILKPISGDGTLTRGYEYYFQIVLS